MNTVQRLMARNRVGRLLLAVISLSLLPGCFELSQDIWIYEDLTGTVKMEFALSEALMAFGGEMQPDPLADMRAQTEDARAALEAHPNVAGVRTEEYKEGGMHRFAFFVDIRDVRLMDDEFTTLLNQYGMFAATPGDGESTPTWTMRFENPVGRNVRYIQQIAINPDATNQFQPKRPDTGGADEPFAELGEAMGRAMMSSMFGDKYITLRLHAPHIVSADGVINGDATSVTWQIPIADLMSDEPLKRELHAEYQLPFSWAPVAIGGLALAVVLFVTAVVLRGRSGQVPRPDA